MAWFIYQAVSDTAVVLFGVFGLVVSYIAREIEDWPRRLCTAIFSISIASAVISLLKCAVVQEQAPVYLYRAFYFAGLLTAPVVSLLMVLFFLFYCRENWRGSAFWYVQLTLTALLEALAVISLLTGVLKITSDYKVQKSHYIILYILLIAAISITWLVALIRRWKKLGRIQWVMFLICMFSLDYIQIIFLELFLMSELVRRYLEQAREMARQRTRIAVTQMRPHFIYNTMMTIYYLCAKDPEKAQEVTLHFSNYLQSNFQAIAKEGLIPFSEELEHTKAYLEVEKARFTGQLFVEFDTPVTFFFIPPLTLQPIVENAIKHGLDPDLDPLYVSILTCETEKENEIIVEDTGPGFDPLDGDETYLTLRNVRERLKMMCSGTLDIEPRRTGGTRVMIRIPVKKQGSGMQPLQHNRKIKESKGKEKEKEQDQHI